MNVRYRLGSTLVVVTVLLFCFGLAVLASETVSLTFQETEYRDIYETLGSILGLNVLVDPSVQGKWTFSLSNVTVMEALELVSSLSGYDYVIKEKTMLVASNERLTQYQTSETRYIHINNVSPERLRASLSLVLDPDNIYIDSENNLVILKGIPAVLDEAEKIVRTLEQPPVLSLESKEQSVLEVFFQLTEVLNLNLIADSSLDELKLAISFRQLEPQVIIANIAEMFDLTVSFNEDTLSVTRNQVESKEKVKVYRLNYADPTMVSDILGLLVDSSKIKTDPATKSIIIKANENLIEEADEFIASYDQALPQVLLEVWVQEITSDALEKLGIELAGIKNTGSVDIPKIIEFAWEPWELILALQALETQGKSKLLASPKIATISGEEASIFVGDRVPIILSGEEGESRMEFLESGIDLRVQPRVSEDGFITIRVSPQVSSFIWQTDSDYPQIRTREAATVVRVKDGQPIFIGGLLQEQETELIKSIPILSQLPILGRLFQWTESKGEQTEMTIFLIPRIIDGSEGISPTSFIPVP